MNIDINILVLTETKYLSDLITNLLTQRGYTVCGVVKNNKELFNSYDLLQPDIVILDLDIMHDLNNAPNIILELLAFDSNALIICIGDNATDNYKKIVLNSGAKEYLCKPFQPANLWERVGRIVKNFIIDKENNKTISVARETISPKETYLSLPKFNQPVKNHRTHTEDTYSYEEPPKYKNNSTEDLTEHKVKSFFKKIMSFFIKNNKL